MMSWGGPTARLKLVRIIEKKGRPMSWKELGDEVVKELGGPINPNTLNFHLHKLIQEGYVVTSGSRYTLAER